MIKVYGKAHTRSLRITFLLEELGLDYAYQAIDFAQGDHLSPQFLAVNPNGKVPAIEDGELVLFESAAIVSYLADTYGDESIIPPLGTHERAYYEQWNRFAVCELEQGLWTIAKSKFALPPEYRVPEIQRTAAWEFQRALKIVERGLGDNDYLVGNRFSAVDILIAHTLQWGVAFKQPIEQPSLQAYRERIMGRPACARAIAREQAELEKR